MWPVLAVAVTGVCAAAALWFLRRPLARWRRLLAASAQLPGPALPRLSLGDDPLAVFAAACRSYGTPCRLWVGHRLYVLLSDPEHAKAVLGGANGAFHERDRLQSDALRPFTGGGLVTATTAQGWRLRRRLVEQTLTPEWVESQRGWLQRVAQRLVAALSVQQVSSAERQVKVGAVVREVRACSLDALAGSLLGQQARATGRPPAGFPHHYLQAAALLGQRASRPPPFLPRPLLSLTSAAQAQSRLVRQLHGYIDAAIDNAVHSSTRDQESHIAFTWERTAESGDDPDRLAGSALELLLALAEADGEGEEGAAGAGAEERQRQRQRRAVREELASLLLAGQPAAEAALCFALQLLALHPQVQSAAVRDEKLLQRAVLESLRLFPVVPLLSRQLSEDVALPGRRQWSLPQGCTAVVCSLITHRDPEHWPDPDAFQPDRFLEEQPRRHPYAYLAFGGGGPRRCPGSGLALHQVCATLDSLLRAFRVVTAGSRDDLEQLRMRTTLAPRAGFQLQLVPRA